MNIVLAKNGQPIYEQLYEQISAQILKGELAADTCLPSIRSIARELQISIITVKTAYEMLERNGFIYTQAGKGCFVADHAPHILVDKKLAMAQTRLKVDLSYYKSLGLTQQELLALIERLYNANDENT